jgi:hypothetical protein
MKKLIFFFLISSIGFAQTISKQVIGAAGKTLSNSNLSLSYTVGEPIVGLMSNAGMQLSNGNHNGLNIQALNIEDNNLNVQIKIYPNPTSQFIFVSHPYKNTFKVQITDINGKQIYVGNLNNEQALDISAYAEGMYLLTLIGDADSKKNTYKLLKK